MWMKWVGGIWDLLTIYGKNEVVTLIVGRTKMAKCDSYCGTEGVLHIT